MEPNPDNVETGLDANGNPRTISGNFQVQMNLSQHRNLVITGYLYSDDSLEQINKRLDDAQDAMDRQFVRVDIVSKEAQVRAILADVERQRDALAELAAKNAAGGDGLSEKKPHARLSSVERQKLQNGEQSMKGLLAHVDSLRAAIKEGRDKLGLVT
jgi:uncharacterized phage infection (PIP) family protein YhgE